MDASLLGDSIAAGGGPGPRRGTAPAARLGGLGSTFEAQFNHLARFPSKEQAPCKAKEPFSCYSASLAPGGHALAPTTTPALPDDLALGAQGALDWLRCNTQESDGAGISPADLARLLPVEPEGGVEEAPQRPPAPLWQDAGPLPPSSRTANVAARPADVRAALSGFFLSGASPIEVQSSEAWTFRATAFIDYMALGVQANIYAKTDGGSLVLFKHTSMNDIVRFSRHVSQARAHLRSRGLSVTEKAEQLEAPTFLDEDFSDDDFDDDFAQEGEAPWDGRIAALLEDTKRATAAVREQAWQCLALMGESSPASHPYMARSLLAEPSGVAAVVKMLKAGKAAPLAEAYPLASALTFASLAHDGQPLSGELMSLLLAQDHYPTTVARELRKALCNLQTNTATAGQAASLAPGPADAKDCAQHQEEPRCHDVLACRRFPGRRTPA